MLRIKVEATSANVCVGFDVLGIALSLTNEFTFERKNDFSFLGFDAEFSTKESNLVYEAYKYVFDYAKEEIIPVEIGFKGDIPVSRGLGSSSSLIVAGIFAANYYLGNKYSKRELFDIATTLEGHPDNVAPAIYGGLVASYQKDNKYYPNLYPIHKDLKFRFSDGDIHLLKDLFSDRLHEPYRSKLIKDYDTIKNLIKDDDVAFAISGSGSTMLMISKDLDFIPKLLSKGFNVKTLTVGSGVSVEELKWKMMNIM